MRSRQRGQSVVEFGLLALLFTLLLFGIGDFGLLLNGWVSVSSAAREGARRASVGAYVLGSGGVAGVIDSAQNFAPAPGVRPSQVRVVVHYAWPSDDEYFCSPGAAPPAPHICDTFDSPTSNPGGSYSPTAGTTVTVTVTADTFEVITPLVRPFFGCGGSVAHCYVPITSSTSMRFEGVQ